MKQNHATCNDSVILNALEQIYTPEYDMSGDVLKRLHSAPRKKIYRKPFAITVTVCLCLILTVPVLAAFFPSFNALLSLVSPEIAQFLQPVQLVSESNGIKMEVVAAMNDDETAIIYLTLQDLTGDRIDESINLQNFIAGEYTFKREVVAYDEATRTATIRLLVNGGTNLNGKKITVGMESFLSNLKEYETFDIGVNLAGVNSNVNTVTLDNSYVSGMGWGSRDREIHDLLENQGMIEILKPNELNIPLPGIDFAYISNIGIIDGRLHVQLHWTREDLDEQGRIYITDASGGSVYSNVTTVYFGTYENGRIIDKGNESCPNSKFIDGEGNVYYINNTIEYIFDVKPENLADCRLAGESFSKYNNNTSGAWQTTFKIEAVKELKSTGCDIDLGRVQINRVSVSPISITAFGNAEESYSANMNVLVTMIDGSVKEYSARFNKINGGTSGYVFTDDIVLTSSHEENGEINLKIIFPVPLDIDKVVSVSINENPIILK